MAVPQTILSPWLLQQALRVNLDHGVIYLNNPKSGCTTVKTGLWLALQGQAPPLGSPLVHTTVNSPLSKALTDADAARRAFVFSFERNPLQRLVSAYLDKVVARRDSIWTEFATRFGADPVQAPSFDGFVEVLSGVPPELQNPHWRAQHLNILYPFVRPNLLADLGALRRELPVVLGRLSTRHLAEIPPRRITWAQRRSGRSITATLPPCGGRWTCIPAISMLFLMRHRWRPIPAGRWG
jgi:hypothetical protein